MARKDAKSREKLNLVLGHACQVLRELFKKTWKERFGNDWSKDSSYRILGHDLPNVEPIHNKLIEEGDVDKWDLTTLRAVLTVEDLLKLPHSQTSRIVELDNIQSEIAQLPTSIFDESRFKEMFGRLQCILAFFGVPVEILERIKQSEQVHSQASTGHSSTSHAGGGDVPSPKLNPKLDDGIRMDRINAHRRWINQCRVMMNTMSTWPTAYQTSFTVEVPLTQELPQNFYGFKPILIPEMNPFYDKVYKGRTLAVTIIDETGFTGSSIVLVVEDENRDVERCAIYGSPHMKDEDKARQVFGPGCKMTIIGPYMRMALDGKPAIRVDEPATIIMRGYVPKMCRYCGKSNAAKSCGGCKSAAYCDRTCQKLDWKKLNHKLICHKYYPVPPYTVEDVYI